MAYRGFSSKVVVDCDVPLGQGGLQRLRHLHRVLSHKCIDPAEEGGVLTMAKGSTAEHDRGNTGNQEGWVSEDGHGPKSPETMELPLGAKSTA